MRIMDNKGQGIFERVTLMIPLIILLYITFAILNPLFNDLLFPLLGNFTYGSVVQIIFQLVPLLLAVLIILFLTRGDGRQQPPTAQYQY